MSNEPAAIKMEESDPSTAQMTFDNPEEPHDIVFVVKGKKFYCSKIDLAKQSDYFKAMLFGQFDEKGKTEIPLKTPESPEEFEAFLMVINAIKCLTDDNVEGVLRLSDAWQAPIAKSRCLDFLMTSSKKTSLDLFDLSLQFNLEALEEKILSELTTIEQLHSIIPENRSHWDPDTTRIVFEKLLELTGYKSMEAQARESARQLLDLQRLVDAREADDERVRQRAYVFRRIRHQINM